MIQSRRYVRWEASISVLSNVHKLSKGILRKERICQTISFLQPATEFPKLPYAAMLLIFKLRAY